LKSPTEAARAKEKLAMEFLKDLWGFLNKQKKFWLLPLIVIILMLGALMVFVSGSAMAPLIYTLF
jgi:hypothetical protein